MARRKIAGRPSYLDPRDRPARRLEEVRPCRDPPERRDDTLRTGEGKSFRGSCLYTGFFSMEDGLWYCPGAGMVAARWRAFNTSENRGDTGMEWPRVSMLNEPAPKLLRWFHCCTRDERERHCTTARASNTPAQAPLTRTRLYASAASMRGSLSRSTRRFTTRRVCSMLRWRWYRRIISCSSPRVCGRPDSCDVAGLLRVPPPPPPRLVEVRSRDALALPAPRPGAVMGFPRPPGGDAAL